MAKKKTEDVQILAVRNNRKSLRFQWMNGSDKYDVTFHDNPLPSFGKSLDALNEHVCSLCEFPASDEKKVQATGITVRADGENALALIVARKRIKKGKRIFNIATPLLPMYADEENKSVDFMDEAVAKAIEKVIAEAKKYISGDRSQGQIEFDDPDPAEKGDKKGEGTAEFPAMTEQ